MYVLVVDTGDRTVVFTPGEVPFPFVWETPEQAQKAADAKAEWGEPGWKVTVAAIEGLPE